MMLTQLAARVPVLFKTFADRKLDAVELLIQDHLKIEGLCMRLRILRRLGERIPSQAKGIKRRQDQIYVQIRRELERHMMAEEQVFYPACEMHDETRALAKQSFEKHEQVKNLIHDLNQLSVNQEAFDPKLTVMIEDVLQHFHEEEEILFPRVRKIFSKTQLVKMAGPLRNKQKHTRRTTSKAA